MAYQNVGTPRFYINTIEWLKTNNAITLTSSLTSVELNWLPSVWNTLPVNPASYYSNYYSGVPDLAYQAGSLGESAFIAILGHNLTSVGDTFFINEGATDAAIGDGTINEVINIPAYGSQFEYDGFSIGTFNGSSSGGLTVVAYGAIGSMIIGNYYDMPHSPDLNLTMTREYGGIKTIETKGGASLSNAFYTKPPAWGTLGAWEIGVGDPNLSKSGRRIWDLSFSYLDDGDVWGSNQSLGGYMADGITATGYQPYEGEQAGVDAGYDSADINHNPGYFEQNLLTDYSFYSQVIHKTNGGQLPFIFQPDAPRLNTSTGLYEGGNNNPDGFAICKFDSGFKFEQVANGVYNVKLKIREVW